MFLNCHVISTFANIVILVNMKLFVIEGLDGAGKSTQIKLLKDFLLSTGLNCEYLHFPRTEVPFFGELIARFLRGEFGTLNEVNPYLVAMLYAGDRKDASDLISQWLHEGKIVILDRYTYSNIAYQCAKLIDLNKRNELMNWILKLEFEHFAIPKPDLNIFLDVPFSFTKNKLTNSRAGSDRIYLKGDNDIHESSLSFQEKVREMYIHISEVDQRLLVVNCSNSNGEMLAADFIFKMIINNIKDKGLL
jgi:dTMP kinase